MKRLVVLVCLLVASSASAENEHLDDRHIAIAGFGLVWMQIDGVTNSGMALQPTLQRTFDRLELQAEYLIADLRDPSKMQPGSVLHRIGFTGRYQAGRVRVERTMTLDLVVEGGIGLDYIARDTGDAFGRNDLLVGLGFRMLADANPSTRSRAFMGVEMMTRMMVSPSGDKAFGFVFGVPFGR